jgi:hypothetical protein
MAKYSNEVTLGTTSSASAVTPQGHRRLAAEAASRRLFAARLKPLAHEAVALAICLARNIAISLLLKASTERGLGACWLGNIHVFT